VLPSDDAIVLCFAVPVNPNDDIDTCRERFERDFQHLEKVGLFNKSGRVFVRAATMNSKPSKKLPMPGNIDKVEMQIDKSAAGEDKRFLVHVVKSRGDNLMYVVIGGARRSRFPRLEGQIREVMDSFRLLPRNARPDW